MSNNISKFFLENGYVIINLFTKNEVSGMIKDVILRMNQLVKGKAYFLKSNWDIGNYHKLNLTKEIDSIYVDVPTRYIPLKKKIIKKLLNNDNILKITKDFWGHSKYTIHWVGNLKKKHIKKNATGFRLARPKKIFPNDVASVHQDLHYGGVIRKDHLATLTIWAPLRGFSEKYTLRIAPKSHLKNHPMGLITSQKKYLVKEFNNAYLKKFKYIRPKLKKGQAILFHPNLLHGGSYNYGKVTRASVDIRIFNILKFKP